MEGVGSGLEDANSTVDGRLDSIEGDGVIVVGVVAILLVVVGTVVVTPTVNVRKGDSIGRNMKVFARPFAPMYLK